MIISELEGRFRRDLNDLRSFLHRDDADIDASSTDHAHSPRHSKHVLNTLLIKL